LLQEFKGIKLDCGYRLEIAVEDKIILELKACEKINPQRPSRLAVKYYCKSLSHADQGKYL
jgi:hypothetical protein